MEFLKANFYWVDFSVGAAFPIAVYTLYKTKQVSRYIWVLFWVGFLLGLCWEIPISVSSKFSSTWPITRYIKPMPTHWLVLLISHSSWDGGLFLIGVWLVAKLCGPAWFEKFRAKELVVFMVWGQASELWVELTSSMNDGWAYIPYWWNPSLFKFNGHDITPLPQLIWLAAPVVYYFTALRLKPKPEKNIL